MQFCGMMYWVLIIVQFISFAFVAIIPPATDSIFFGCKMTVKNIFLTGGRYDAYQ